MEILHTGYLVMLGQWRQKFPDWKKKQHSNFTWQIYTYHAKKKEYFCLSEFNLILTESAAFCWDQDRINKTNLVSPSRSQACYPCQLRIKKDAKIKESGKTEWLHSGQQGMMGMRWDSGKGFGLSHLNTTLGLTGSVSKGLALQTGGL